MLRFDKIPRWLYFLLCCFLYFCITVLGNEVTLSLAQDFALKLKFTDCQNRDGNFGKALGSVHIQVGSMRISGYSR